MVFRGSRLEKTCSLIFGGVCGGAMGYVVSPGLEMIYIGLISKDNRLLTEYLSSDKLIIAGIGSILGMIVAYSDSYFSSSIRLDEDEEEIERFD